MTIEAFLAWETRQPEKWELVDGAPRRRHARMMVGGTRRRSAIGANIVTSVSLALRGGQCRAHGSDLKIVCPSGASRYADTIVDCGRPTGPETAAVEPAAIFEVLSKSNAFPDQIRALEDYQSIPSVLYVACFSQDRPFAQVWSRTETSWVRTEYEGLTARAVFPRLGAGLSFLDVYNGVPSSDEER